MNGKSLGMLGLALLCGLGAMVGTSKMLAKSKPTAVSTQNVLVAVRDLKVEEVLTPELVKLVPMAGDSVPPGAFSSFKDVESRWVLIRTLEGEPILDRKLAPRGSPAGLVSRIHPGMRAFTLEVNEQTGVSGFILPDHRVDVLLSVADPKNKREEATTILQNIPVLASGQVFTRPDDPSIQSRTVTLEVSPEDVDVLVAARAKGSLSLSLRGLNDNTLAPKSELALKLANPDVEEEETEPEPPPPPPAISAPAPAPVPPVAKPEPPRRTVWIYRGLRNTERVPLSRSAAEQEAQEQARQEQDDNAFPGPLGQDPLNGSEPEEALGSGPSQ